MGFSITGPEAVTLSMMSRISLMSCTPPVVLGTLLSRSPSGHTSSCVRIRKRKGIGRSDDTGCTHALIFRPDGQCAQWCHALVLSMVARFIGLWCCIDSEIVKVSACSLLAVCPCELSGSVCHGSRGMEGTGRRHSCTRKTFAPKKYGGKSTTVPPPLHAGRNV